MEEYEEDYESSCPKCDHSPTRYRNCSALACEDGEIDENFDDPINNPQEGVSFFECITCYGTGIEQWCPNCGYNISDHNKVQEILKAQE